MEENNKKIYIDLDSVLDTRFSLLYKLDKKMLDEIYVNDEYKNRIINEFGYITSNTFKTIYRYRGDSVLNLSYFTNILGVLNMEIGILKNNLQLLNLSQPITIDLNIHPYNVSDKQQTVIKDAMLAVMNMSEIFINIIDVPPKQLTPVDISSTYSTLIMYDGMDWFNYMLNSEKFRNNNIPLVKLILPALLDKPVVLKKTEDYEDMFNDIMKESGYFINLKFVPVEYFNIKM